MIYETKAPEGYFFDDTCYLYDSINDGEVIEFVIKNNKVSDKSPATGDVDWYRTVNILLALSALFFLAGIFSKKFVFKK